MPPYYFVSFLIRPINDNQASKLFSDSVCGNMFLIYIYKSILKSSENEANLKELHLLPLEMEEKTHYLVSYV